MRRWLRWIGNVIEDRTGLLTAVKPLLYHKVPPNLGWAYVLGSATMLALVLQIVTGIALATAYIPSPADAYNSLQFITHQARFGNLLRGMHFYGASAMVTLITLHAIRTYLYGSYKFPREVNWLTGVVLLGLTLLMAWTGQLLRWDENGFWTVVVGAHIAERVPLIGAPIAQFMLAGQTVGGPTLSRFYIFHVLFLPLFILGIVFFHLYLVIRNGISEPPEPGRPVDPSRYRPWYQQMLKEKGQPFWPAAAWRDAVFGLLVVGAVLTLALFFGAVDLAGPPDPTRLTVQPTPDWYFRWYDALVTLAPPQLQTAVMLGVPTLLALLLLGLPFVANQGERSPWRRPWAPFAVAVLAALFFWLTFASRQPALIPVVDIAPLPLEVVGESEGPVAAGAYVFYEKACLHCHAIAGYGGQLGPDLTYAADHLPFTQIEMRILMGSPNMPAYVEKLTAEEYQNLLAFLASRQQ